MAKITHRAAKILAQRIYDKVRSEKKDKPLTEIQKKLIKEYNEVGNELDKLRNKQSTIFKSLQSKGLSYGYDTLSKKQSWTYKNQISFNLVKEIEEDIILSSEFDKLTLEALEKSLVSKYLKKVN